MSSSPLTPDEERAQKLAFDSLGDRIWATLDVYFFMAISGVVGFCLGMLIMAIMAYANYHGLK
jgi:hypothetical protein